MARRGDNKSPTRTEEAAIAKILRERFPGWSLHATDGTVRDGHTLRSRIRADRAFNQANPAKRIKSGKLYYLRLRELFGTEAGAIPELEARDPDEEPDEEMMDCLEGLFEKSRNFDLIMVWLESSGPVNQASLAGLLRAMLLISPSSTDGGVDFAIAVGSYVVRNGMHTQHEDMMAVCKTHWDTALMKSYNDLDKNRLTPSEWFDRYTDCCALVLPLAAAKTCFEVKLNESWAKAEEELMLVCASSELGRLMFEDGLNQVTDDKVLESLQTHVKSLGGEHITKRRVDACRTDFVNSAKKNLASAC